MSHRWPVLVALFVVLMAPVALMQSPDRPTQKPGVSDGPDARTTPSMAPLNTTAADAAILIPDGTSVSMAFAADVPQWFAARVEFTKSYVVEAMLSGTDRSANDVALALFENDGATAFTGTFDCSAETNSAAPSMQSSSTGFLSADGARCSFTSPLPAGTNQGSLVLVRVSSGFTGTVKVRMRETTVYSRWTTNGYNMYVPVHNPSQASVSGCVVYYSEGTTGTGPSSWVGADCFTLGGWGSTQFYHPAGTWPPNKGQLRVVISKGTDVQVQTYAFNPTAGVYLNFFPERLNHGSGGSW